MQALLPTLEFSKDSRFNRKYYMPEHRTSLWTFHVLPGNILQVGFHANLTQVVLILLGTFSFNQNP